MNIKTPPKPNPSLVVECGQSFVHGYTDSQLAARDAEWLALVGPLVEALEKIAGQVYDPWTNGAEAGRIARNTLTNITKD